MKRFLLTNLVILGLFIIGLSGESSASQPEPPTPPEKTSRQSQLGQVEQAIQTALQGHKQAGLVYLAYETQVSQLALSRDGQWAVGWLTPVDPETKQVIPTEPGLAVVRRTETDWQAILPADDSWLAAVENLPNELLSEEIRQSLIVMNSVVESTLLSTPLTGYRLPWEAGKTVWLSRSTAHDKDITSGSAHYSFDFYIYKTMFNLHAARAGTVYLYKDTVPNDDHSDVNYLVLEDTSTDPTTYQLYLHLAQNSIPESLKVIGAPVQRGQFIGVADNTGASTGHHLHFQIQALPYFNSYWGVSLDMVFDEVDINGGRPRVLADLPYCTRPDDVCNDTRTYYVSANTVTGDRTPPVGDLSAPSDQTIVSTGSLTLSGWASDDDSGLHSAQFIASYGGSWHNIGPEFTSSPFSLNWDLCSAGVPDGPISLALRLRDEDGNYNLDLPGLRHLLKNYTCPAQPPICTADVNQVALFAEQDYGGACAVLSSGSYNTINNLGDNNAESIQVGANVLATLYINADLTGRSETFSGNDSNLADNRIGTDRLSSLRVQARTSAPSVPVPSWPASGYSFRPDSSPVLTWEDAGGGTSYEVKISGPSAITQVTYAPFLSPGSLPAGSYSWTVRSINNAGSSAASSASTFVIETPATPPSIQPVPYFSGMETDQERALWVNSGNWDWTYNDGDINDVIWSYDAAGATAGYDTGQTNYGDLTSPPFSIPSGGYYLRFLYKYQTEGPGLHWDRRVVQVSENNGPFETIYQFSEDPPNYWLQSPFLDLSSYSGSTIRVRFHFETLDSAYNNYLGWFIDDFSISTEAPPDCADSNDTFESASPLDLPASTSKILCPAGDVDFYRFNGQAGDQVGVSAQAGAGSDADTYLYLLDSDGKSVLAENDDMILNTLTNSALSYRLPRTGTYYVKVRDWAHPSAGELSHTYTLQIYKESARPAVSISAPPGSTFLSSDQTGITVQATDAESGLSHVDFYWHSGDWQSGSWEKIASDWDGSDGWQAVFNALNIPDQLEMAFYALAEDWAGNQRFAGIWHLGLDRTPPVSSISAFPASLNSTVIPVAWLASDNLSGIDHFDLQRQTGTAAWENWALNIDGNARHLWVIAEAGKTYGFKLRAVDRIGNAEAYTSLAERTVSLPATVCTAYDAWETYGGASNDNAPDRAGLADFDHSTQIRNLCNPADAGGLQDEDWLRISLKAEQTLSIHSQPLIGSAAAVLELYAEDGTTLLAQHNPGDFDLPSHVGWFTDRDRTLYLRIRSIDGRVAGDLVRYQLSIQTGLPIYLPMIAVKP
jgi:hypothetical protein